MDAVASSTGIIARLGQWVESPVIQRYVTGLIILNAIILGLDTSPAVMSAVGGLLTLVDEIILWIFVAELAIRIAYRRASFFKDGWNIFDFCVVAIALAPVSQSLSALRALRVLRVLRLITVLPKLRMIVGALVSSLPSLGMILLLQALVFYVASVITTKLFGTEFPEWFGTIGASLYTLFQVMTLESWSMGIVRPVMEKFPLAWVFFVPFILAATFTMLNLFIAVIVNALTILQAEETAEINQEIREATHTEMGVVLDEVRNLKSDLAALRTEMMRLGERV